ncbi:centromere protein W isoform X1 [Carlito syrichta]|uniref:Centromere protein W n=1 Tax=Carlito syrichta TaxID=1868482 RepID=A0A3Q0DSM4_CARSF|nr:centromere protein W isoform X1 [Carlito syrichta]
MAFSTTVPRRKRVKRKAPRGFLKRVFKRRKPHLRLEKSGDLLVRFHPFLGRGWGPGEWGKFIHLNCLLFVHRLAEESRTNACENKCGIINKEHILTAAKVILKKSRG